MYELTTLDNGLRILSVPMPQFQSVSLGFFVGVGSRYESNALAGASHFIEHMLFKGTPRRPTPLDIADAIEGRGGMFDASTSVESTLYWAKVAAPHLPLAVDVLGDMLLHASFDPQEMEKERTVITEEINYSLDTPDSLAQILVSELQWPDHPLGRDIAGSRESVAALDRESVLGYMSRHYRPGDTVLGLAGQVTHAEAVSLAAPVLAEWAPGPPAAYEPAPPDHAGPKLRVEARDTEQAHLAFSFSGLSRRHPDRYVLRLINVVLGEGMRSRLFQQVRERLGLVYSIDSYASMMQDSGSIGIYAGVAPESAGDAIRAILRELDRLRQEPVPEDELIGAKEFSKGRLALALEDSFSVASWYARQELFGPDVLEPEQVLARIDAVQASDLQCLAQRVFQSSRVNLVAVGPCADQQKEFEEALRF